MLFDQAIHHAPHDPSAYNNRALARRDPSAALTDLDVAIRLQPRFAEAWNNRAAVHFELGDYEASLRDLDEAVTLGGDPDYLRNRAHLYETLGRSNEAAADHAAASAAPAAER